MRERERKGEKEREINSTRYQLLANLLINEKAQTHYPSEISLYTLGKDQGKLSMADSWAA